MQLAEPRLMYLFSGCQGAEGGVFFLYDFCSRKVHTESH